MGIKRFLLRLVVFSLVAFPFIFMESLYAYYTRSYKKTVNGNEIYVSVSKSKAKKKVKVFVFGDSVAKQLYDNETYNDTVYSVACNQAVSLVGQYILLKSFFENNKDSLPGKVVFIIMPLSFYNNLDQLFTYHYFLKPFYKEEYKKYFTGLCNEQIRKVPLYFTSQLPFIVSNNWSPTYNNTDKKNYQTISPISSEYLIKIKALCLQNKVKFDMYCPPVKEGNRKEMIHLAKSTNEFKQCGMEREFATYFSNIKYMPDSLYQDHIHFKKQYIPVDYFNLTPVK
jgi:archaellum component FlaF (FlaF/FlaG flagellin family)